MKKIKDFSLFKNWFFQKPSIQTKHNLLNVKFFKFNTFLRNRYLFHIETVRLLF